MSRIFQLCEYICSRIVHYTYSHLCQIWLSQVALDYKLSFESIYGSLSTTTKEVQCELDFCPTPLNGVPELSHLPNYSPIQNDYPPITIMSWVSCSAYVHHAWMIIFKKPWPSFKLVLRFISTRPSLLDQIFGMPINIDCSRTGLKLTKNDLHVLYWCHISSGGLMASNIAWLSIRKVQILGHFGYTRVFILQSSFLRDYDLHIAASIFCMVLTLFSLNTRPPNRVCM